MIADKGYQDDQEPKILSPKKSYAGHVFTPVELEYNRAINKKRVVVERMNGRVKFFGCFKAVWRHTLGLQELAFTVACQLVNVFLETEPMNQEE